MVLFWQGVKERALAGYGISVAGWREDVKKGQPDRIAFRPILKGTLQATRGMIGRRPISLTVQAVFANGMEALKKSDGRLWASLCVLIGYCGSEIGACRIFHVEKNQFLPSGGEIPYADIV